MSGRDEEQLKAQALRKIKQAIILRDSAQNTYIASQAFDSLVAEAFKPSVTFANDQLDNTIRTYAQNFLGMITKENNNV